MYTEKSFVKIGKHGNVKLILYKLTRFLILIKTYFKYILLPYKDTAYNLYEIRS